MTKSTPRVLSLIIALLAAGSLLVAGCGDSGGGGGGGNDQDAQTLLKQAFDSKNASKARDSDVKVKLSADLQGSSQIQGPLTLEFGGPTKSQGTGKLPQLDWTVKGSAMGRTLDAGLVVASDSAFVKYKGQAYKLDDSTFQQLKSQSESQTKSSQSSLKSLGIDPNDFLTDIKKEDGQPVTGIPTDRVTGTVDTEKLIRTFLKVLKSPAFKSQLQGRTPPTISDDQIKQVKDAVKGVDFSVDIGKTDKIVRRLTAKIDFNVPDNVRSQAGGVKGGTFTFDVEVGKLAPGTQIATPSGAKPISELTKQLGGLGALGGLGGGTTPGTPTTPGLPQN
jgi:hypothetical protein